MPHNHAHDGARQLDKGGIAGMTGPRCDRSFHSCERGTCGRLFVSRSPASAAQNISGRSLGSYAPWVR